MSEDGSSISHRKTKGYKMLSLQHHKTEARSEAPVNEASQSGEKGEMDHSWVCI